MEIRNWVSKLCTFCFTLLFGFFQTFGEQLLIIMENKNACSDSWQSDSSLNPHHPQWLQTTLSDLEKKMKAMLTVIEDSGDHLAPSSRLEMFCQKRAQLTQMIEELCGSFRSLAEKYDKLSSESTQYLNSGRSSLSSDSRKIQYFSANRVGSSVDSKFEAFDSQPESVVEDPEEGEFDVTNLDYGSLHKVADNSMANKACSTSLVNTTLGLEDLRIINFDLNRKTFGDFMMGTFDGERTWYELKLQVTKLMEENVQQQAELIKRNKEKRDVIKELHFQVERLKGENRALRSCCLRRSSNNCGVNQNQSHKSILKGRLSLCKFFRGGDGMI